MAIIDKSILETTAKHEEDLKGTTAIEQTQYQLSQDANRAEELEKNMPVMTALKLWWPAVVYSTALSTAVIMEGFDNLLLTQFYALPAFCKKFGELASDGTYQISPGWQAGLSNGCLAGEIIGLHLNGMAIEWLGYKKTIYISLASVFAFIFVVFFAESLIVLEIGQILCGIPWGVFQTLTCAYASDVCPIKLRPYLTTYTNLCWVIGQLIGSGVVRALVERTDEWSYRIPFALQWFWVIPIGIAVIFAPESPWWLVRHDRNEEAKESLRRLTDPKNGPASFNLDDTLTMIIVTDSMEKAQTHGAGYLDCFKGDNLRRTEISCVTWAIQNLCGSAFMNYSTYFYIRAGLPTVMSFSMTLVQYAIGFCGTFLSWYLMTKFGRRTLFGAGLFVLFSVLLSIGIASLFNNNAGAWAIGSLLVFYTAVYNSTIGPITYSLVSEIPSTRMKNKTIVLARNVFNVAGILNFIIVPYMLNPNALNWGGRSGFFWAALCSTFILWTYFRLPEPKDRSYADLDELFERKISARKFSKTVVHRDEE
ncbi:Alpha-glucosides permease MPH2 [Golovinomyces cichoracearum]|uniref:Alpha-glucosides permease MPH2 n=1 Tax=Golovinomyces cichoracearum TaxID=62708 RepID=A0A420IZP5_9PEZI|nr:Alpha-glucosides permease MPH2 [Golovinomyces cichoracearum]